MSEPSRQPIAALTRAAWLFLPLIVAAAWTLAAQSASASDSARLEELERRVSQLEDKLRTRGNSVQIRGPLEVTDAGGNVVLHVGGDPEYAGAAVSISRGAAGGRINLARGGRHTVVMGASQEGDGRVITHRPDGSAGAIAAGNGWLGIYAPGNDNVINLSATPEGTGRIAIYKGDTRIATLGQTGNAGTLMLAESAASPSVQLGPGQNGNTALRIYNPAGTPVAVLGVDPSRDDTGTLLVSNSKGGVSAAVMGGDRGAVVVADGSGATVAQMSVSPEARGIFQVFNFGVSVAALTKGATGGMLQLGSDGGVPMVEAGVMANGRGTVRAGPMFKCFPAQAATPVMSLGLPDCLVGSD
jgi:hypothetical protein